MGRALRSRHRIVLAVTSAQSLVLMKGFPEYLSSRGWDVHVVCSDPGKHLYQGVTLHDLPMAREPSPAADLRSLMAWFRLLWKLRPTTVVAGTPKAGLLGTTAARLTGVPSRVYMLRGLRLESERGMRRRLLQALEWVSARASTSVLAVSHSLLDEFVGMGLCAPHKAVVLGAGSSNGVEIPGPEDRERLAGRGDELRDELGLDRDRPTVGFVGRLSRDKGLPVLLSAVQRLHAEGIHIQLLIVGPEEPIGYLDDTLRQARLSREAIVHAGAVPDVAPYYGLMDVLCLPTRREGFPNVVLEAAAHEVPSVVSRVTGAVDSVVEGHTGFLFQHDDPVELAGILSGLTKNASNARVMGENARERASKSFNRQLVWGMTESFLQDEVGGIENDEVGA